MNNNSRGKLIIGGIVILAAGLAGVSTIMRIRRRKRRSTRKADTTSKDEKTGSIDPESWRDLLQMEMEIKGMGKFEEELDAFMQSFVPVHEAMDFRKRFDDLAEQVGSPYEEMSAETAAVWAALTVMLHLRLRVCYDDNRHQLMKELKTTSLLLPMTAASAASSRGNRYEPSRFITSDIISQIMEGLTHEEEEPIYEPQFASATT